MTLHLGRGLDLPDTAGTETFGLLGNRGAGKSNAAAVMAEAMWDAGIPWVAVDPKGDWWGLRAAADGTPGGGLPIPIFGGLRGDLPLEVGGGAYLADLVYDRDLTCLLDVSRLSKADRARFLIAFADQLYARHQAEPRVRHLFFEEAHEYLPQTVGREEGRLKDALTRIVLFGRSFGLGATLASQRSARLHNDVLTQVGTLLAMRNLAAVDRKAIQGWVTEHNVAVELLASLPALQPGQAWLWSPSWLRRVDQVEFRQRRTFDSGATPTLAGGKSRPSPTLAELDLAAIKDDMAGAIERAKADDPQMMRRRIAQLERDLAAARAVTGLPTELVELLTAKADGVAYAYGQVAAAMTGLDVSVDMLRAAVRTSTLPRPAPQSPAPTPAPRPRRAAAAVRDAPPPAADELVKAAAGALDTGVWDGMLKHEQTLFTTLARHRGGLNRMQLALLSGYTYKSSSIKNGLGALRRMGLMTPANVEPLALTPAGIILADGLKLPALPSGQALYEYWTGRLRSNERAVLQALIDQWPEEVSRAAISKVTGYSIDSSTIKNALGRLRSLGLVDKWRAADEFVEAINQ